MQKWPYAGFAYISADHFSFTPNNNAQAQKREFLTVEAVFVPDSETVMFFDQYANEYKQHRVQLDVYLEKLAADGWKLTLAGHTCDGKSYQFRRYVFRRVLQ